MILLLCQLSANLSATNNQVQAPWSQALGPCLKRRLPRLVAKTGWIEVAFRYKPKHEPNYIYDYRMDSKRKPRSYIVWPVKKRGRSEFLQPHLPRDEEQIS